MGHLEYTLKTNDTLFSICDPSAKTCSVTGLEPGTQYTVSIRACIIGEPKMCGDESPHRLVYTFARGSFEKKYNIRER